jgi:hypothetical protein
VEGHGSRRELGFLEHMGQVLNSVGRAALPRRRTNAKGTDTRQSVPTNSRTRGSASLPRSRTRGSASLPGCTFPNLVGRRCCAAGRTRRERTRGSVSLPTHGRAAAHPYQLADARQRVPTDSRTRTARPYHYCRISDGGSATGQDRPNRQSPLSRVHKLFARSKAAKPACSKCRSPVSASLKPSSPIATNEMQSVNDHSLSGRSK